VIGPLAHDAAFDAVTLPGLQEMAAWDVDAAEMIIEASHGYPYFIQQLPRKRGTTRRPRQSNVRTPRAASLWGCPFSMKDSFGAAGPSDALGASLPNRHGA